MSPSINWKEAARHFRLGRYLAEQQEIRLKVRLGQEHERRVRLANTLADILMNIAYDEDDADQEYCNVCHRSLIEEDGHTVGCLYVLALAVLAEDGRSVEGCTSKPAHPSTPSGGSYEAFLKGM
jgi:molybdenum cofactor biosynthesis enzyme MoaA